MAWTGCGGVIEAKVLPQHLPAHGWLVHDGTRPPPITVTLAAPPSAPGRVLEEVHGSGQAHGLLLLQVLGKEALQVWDRTGGCSYEQVCGAPTRPAGEAQPTQSVSHHAPRLQQQADPVSVCPAPPQQRQRTVTVEAASTEQSQCVTPT